MVTKVGDTHRELGGPRIELHWSNGFESSLLKIVLNLMRGHVAPAETGQQHRVFRAEIGKAPRAARQYAVVTSCGLRRAFGKHNLYMLLQDVSINRAVERRQLMIGRHHGDEIDGKQGKALQ